MRDELASAGSGASKTAIDAYPSKRRMAVMALPPWQRLQQAKFTAAYAQGALGASGFAAGLKRLDGDNAGHRLDGAGDLRRDLEAAGQLDLDLAAVLQEQHHADLAIARLAAAISVAAVAVTCSAVARGLEAARHAGERLLIAQKYAEPLLRACRRLVERLDRLNAGTHLFGLHLGG